MKFIDFNNFIKRVLIFFGGTDYDIFISYKRGEADLYGSALASYLTEKKYRCYFDQHVRDEGQDDLPVSLKKAVRNSTMLIILGTTQVDSSKWIRQEIEAYNQRKKKNIIPVNFGDAETQKWFELVKIFHSPNESLENLKTGKPSSLILETITNSFNFKKRNERLQNRALLVISSVIILMVGGIVISNNIVTKAQYEAQAAMNAKTFAIAEGKIAKDNAEKYKKDADFYLKQKDAADYSAKLAVKKQVELQATNAQLQLQNETASQDLLASKNALQNATIATKDAENRYRSADSLSKWQENVADAYLLASNALQELDRNPTIALSEAKKAFSKHNSKMTMNVLYRCSIDQNQYKEIEGVNGYDFIRFTSSNTVVNSNRKTLQFNKLIGNQAKEESEIKFDSLKSFYRGNIFFDKKAKIVIWYDKVGSRIAIIENKKVSYRKIHTKIAMNTYNESRELKIIDGSRIAFVDSTRSQILVFDWRQNKTLSTFRLHDHKHLKHNEIGYLTIGNNETIVFTTHDANADVVKVYFWKWEESQKPISTIFTDDALSITSIQKLRILNRDYLLIGNSEGELSVWNSKKKLLSTTIHDGSIKRMELYGDTLITISTDNKIQVLKYDPPYNEYGAGKIKNITTFKGHLNEIFDFDYNAETGLLISNDTDFESQAKLWRIDLQKPLYSKDRSPVSLMSNDFDFVYDMEEIAKRKDLNRNEHYYLIKDSLNLPFIQSDSFISVNINSKKDILIACSKIDNKVYLFDTKGNHIDSLPNQERRMNQDRERYVSADFTENDSLIIVVSNIIRNHTAPMEHIMDDYVVYIYNRKWEKIHSFNVHSGRNVIVWNDYLYKYSIGSYSRTLINPSLIKDNL